MMQRKCWRYRYAGLNVCSEVHLPEWDVFEVAEIGADTGADTGEDPDVRIVVEDAPLQPFSPQVSADDYSFQIDEIGVYRIRRGQSIHVILHPSAGMREVRLFLLGSAWGILCYQRGLLALHASVVAFGGQAVAFSGASGAGKSSMAAWLMAQGHPLIADDLCLFDLTINPPGVFAAAPRVKLWRDALNHFNWATDDLEQDHFRMNKYHVRVTHSPNSLASTELGSSIPLRAIYLLGWGEAGIVRLKGLTALYELIKAATYRGELLESMEATAAHWQRCARLSSSVPIYRLTRPQDWSAEAQIERMLVASLQSVEEFHQGGMHR